MASTYTTALLSHALAVGFIATWSFVWSAQDDLGRLGISFSRRAISLTILRFVLLCIFYFLAVSTGSFPIFLKDQPSDGIRWSFIETAMQTIILFEFLNQSPVFKVPILETLLRWWNGLRARLRYKDFQAATNVLAFLNPLSSLEGVVDVKLLDIPNPKERLARQKEFDLGQQGSNASRRVTLAVALLEELSWSEIKVFGLVPAWAFDRDDIVDPEPWVERLVDFCEQKAITADELDSYVRPQIEGQPAALIFYERMLAESPVETSGRRGLTVRVRCLIWRLGPERAFADREKMLDSILAARNAGVAPVPAGKPAGGAKFQTLKLLSLELENIRCFRSLKIDFSEQGKPRPWTMLLGDNGLGKTTVLRSIALSLCDQTSATALMGLLAGELLRQQTAKGHIRAQLASPDAPDEVWVETTLTRGPSGVEIRQSTSSWFPRDSVFVCGYGALRSGFGTRSPAGYAPSEAVESLFVSTAQLQNPELALRRINTGGSIDRVCRQIERVLVLPADSTHFGPSGLSIKGPWGEFVPMGAIGDGYLATLAWLSDLLGWTFLYRPNFVDGSVSAIVIIDELEKHLHPRWQREIVRELSQQFPDVQFIVASHSPLCAGGLSDLPDDAAAMYRFERKSGAVLAEKLEPYRGWTYDQIMTSSAFGLKSVRDLTTQKITEELRQAYAEGDREQVREKEQELESRSVVAAADERDHLLQEKLMRDIETLQRLADVQKKDGDATS
jgi:hypothetical protein